MSMARSCGRMGCVLNTGSGSSVLVAKKEGRTCPELSVTVDILRCCGGGEWTGIGQPFALFFMGLMFRVT